MVEEEPLPGEHGAQMLIERPVEEEMRSSYIDYAMSVIVGRALPDARDGLKPVHRRILYSLHDMGLTPDKPPRKSARLVGEVLGKYHPHGDRAVYDALVRMAQGFSLRYPLVDGQGNFGSLDGDAAAAMRYTEARMAPIASELLEDLDKDTVDFEPNFDASLEEPTVLPATLPNLLVNGSSGIAVGMATNMAPHNLTEVCDAIALVLDDPDAELEDLMEVCPGPDFPTGGKVMGKRGILKAYGTGHGVVKVRARTTVEETPTGGQRLVVTEIPYQVNKSKLLTDIADLVRKDRIEGISDLRDESDREGLRIVVDLKRGAMPEIVRNNLFKQTQLESSFGILNLALVDGEPEVLTLKGLIEVYIDHRLTVVERRTAYLLQKARDRLHIVEGLLVALDRIDDVIDLIRDSADTAEARAGLMETFDLSEEQARAILDMRLSRLTSLEVQNLRDEQDQLRTDIGRYETILGDESERRAIVRRELDDLKETYGDARRTTLVEEEGEDLVIEDLVPDDPVVVMMTADGYVKRVSLESYRRQRRGGKGLIGMRTKDEDHVVDLFVTTNHRRILFVTEDGIVHSLKALQIPEMDRYARGTPIVGLFERLAPGTSIEAALPVRDFAEDRYLFFATANGKVKKTPLSEYERINVNGKIALRLEEGDRLVGCAITEGDDDIVLVKDTGKGVRFREDQVRPMGRVAAGVKGTECRGDETVVSMVVVSDPDASLLTVTSGGKGKRTPYASYNRKNRGVWGVYMHGTDERTGPVIGAVEVQDDDEVLFTSRNGIIIRSPAKDIRLITSGQAKGVIVQDLDEDDETVAVARLAPGVVEDGDGDVTNDHAPEDMKDDSVGEPADDHGEDGTE